LLLSRYLIYDTLAQQTLQWNFP